MAGYDSRTEVPPLLLAHAHLRRVRLRPTRVALEHTIIRDRGANKQYRLEPSYIMVGQQELQYTKLAAVPLVFR